MFNIINYLSVLEKVTHHATWIEAVCPVCQGKLKISLVDAKYGAYSCYTNDCQKLPGNPIRAIVTKHDVHLPRKESYARTPKYVRLTKHIEPKPLTKIDEGIFSSEVYVDDIKVARFEDGIVTRVYYYDEFELFRLELPNGKKVFYPRHLVNGEYVNTAPTSIKVIPLYKSKYIAESVVMVEGEKTADVLHQLGVNGLTFPAFAFSDVCLPKYMRALSKVVKSLIYLEDNDAPGARKRDLILRAAWEAGIEASSYNLGQIYDTGIKGYDIADAVSEKRIETRESLLHLLWNITKSMD
jgi:hypothetical protein